MPFYEHVMIARQDLSNAQAEGLVEHFGAVLTDNGGKVVDSEYWGVKTMAYKINKNRKGHYAFLKTDAPAPAVQEMERLMRLHDDVMRVLTIKVDAHAEGPSPDDRSKRSVHSPGVGARSESPVVQAPRKMRELAAWLAERDAEIARNRPAEVREVIKEIVNDEACLSSPVPQRLIDSLR